MEPIKYMEFKDAQQLKNEEKYQEALNVITEYEKKKDTRPEEQILGFILKADIHRILGHYKDAISIADEAFEISQKLENKQQEFDSLKIKIQTLTDDHRPIKAKELLNQLINIFQLLKNISGSELMRREADLAYITGRIYFENGDYNQAEEYFKNSLELREKVGDKAEIAENLVHLSYIFAKRADFSQALQGFEENLTLGGIREIDKCLVLASIGAIYITKGELDRALIYNKQWQEIARDIKNESIEASALQERGRIYMMKGDLEKALEISEQSLNLFKATGVIMERANLFFNLIRICIDLDSIAKAKRYLNLFKEFVEEENDVHLTNSYELTHSLVLKRSANLNDRIEAKRLLKSLIEKDLYYGWHNFWEIEAIILLCDLLLMEFQESNNLEILDEIQPLAIKLKEVTKKRNSMSRLAQTNLLLAKLALIKMNMGEARQYLSQAQQISNENGLHLLARAISSEYDNLIENLEKWESLKRQNAPISERLDLVSFNSTIDLMQGRRALEPPELFNEQPISLILISKTGYIILSNPFSSQIFFDENRIGEFISFFNSSSDKIFSKSLDRAKFGEFTILLKTLNSISICYLILGQSYLAQLRLNKFYESLKNNSSILDMLEKAVYTGQPINIEEKPALETLIVESFHSDSKKLHSPLAPDEIQKLIKKSRKIKKIRVSNKTIKYKLVITEIVLEIIALLLFVIQHIFATWVADDPGITVRISAHIDLPLANLVDPLLFTAIVIQIVVIVLIFYTFIKQHLHSKLELTIS